MPAFETHWTTLVEDVNIFWSIIPFLFQLLLSQLWILQFTVTRHVYCSVAGGAFMHEFFRTKTDTTRSL